MKNIVLLLGLFSCSSIDAQQHTINKPIVCSTVEQVEIELAKFGEHSVWTSPSPVEKSNYVFYGNREKGTWTLVQIIDGIGCLVAFGEVVKVKDEM